MRRTGLENTNAAGGLNSRLCNADGSLAPMGRAWLMGSAADCELTAVLSYATS